MPTDLRSVLENSLQESGTSVRRKISQRRKSGDGRWGKLTPRAPGRKSQAKTPASVSYLPMFSISSSLSARNKPTLAFRPCASAFPFAVCMPRRRAPAARALLTPGTEMHKALRIRRRCPCPCPSTTGDDIVSVSVSPPLLVRVRVCVCAVGLGVRLRLSLWRRQCIRRWLRGRDRGGKRPNWRVEWRDGGRDASPLGIGRIKMKRNCLQRRGWIGKFRHGGSVTVTLDLSWTCWGGDSS